MLDAQSLPEVVPQATFPSNVMDLVQNRFGGNYSALARSLQVHRITVFAWANGKHRPSPVSLIALAYCFGGDAMDWIARKIEPATLHPSRSIDKSVAQTVRRPLRRFTTESVRAHLTSVLQAAEFVEIGSDLLGKADYDLKTPVALEKLPGGVPADRCFNYFLCIGDIDAVPGKGRTIEADVEHREPCHLLYFDIGST